MPATSGSPVSMGNSTTILGLPALIAVPAVSMAAGGGVRLEERNVRGFVLEKPS